MYKIYDSHIHFNMKADDIIQDFKNEIVGLEGFILILNTLEEKKLFLSSLYNDFKKIFPLSAVAINYEYLDLEFISLMNQQNIKLGIKLHPRLSNIIKDKFTYIVEKMKRLSFDFIVIDCFYYGSNLETHTNLELSILIAKCFQNKNVLLAHGGGHKVLEYMLYTRDLKNIFYDFSLTSNYLKDTSIKQDIVNFIKFNNSKIFFGSDYPDFNVRNALESYKNFIQKSNIEDEKIKKIFFYNVKDFLGLE